MSTQDSNDLDRLDGVGYQQAATVESRAGSRRHVKRVWGRREGTLIVTFLGDPLVGQAEPVVLPSDKAVGFGLYPVDSGFQGHLAVKVHNYLLVANPGHSRNTRAVSHIHQLFYFLDKSPLDHRVYPSVNPAI